MWASLSDNGGNVKTNQSKVRLDTACKVQDVTVVMLRYNYVLKEVETLMADLQPRAALEVEPQLRDHSS